MFALSIKKNHDSNVAAPRAIYVHVPFCRGKCAYCDFYSLPFEEAAARAYLAAIRREAAMYAHALRRPPTSIYVGGGTPTALGPKLLAELLEALGPHHPGPAEFSIEANPGSTDAPVAKVLAAAGVNRVTLGVQSFHEAELRTLGRTHAPRDVGRAVARLRAAGIENLGVDLIYGIPGQTPASWAQSLRQALALGVEHLSCYALSFEPGTPLQRALEQGRVVEPDEEVQEAMYFDAVEAMTSFGMEQYEISNFAAASRRCRQNLTYWRNESYLGLGPAAASYLGGVRRRNRPLLAGYLRRIEAGEPAPADSERLTGSRAMAETIMLALRMTEGLDLQSFIDRFGVDPLRAFPESLRRHRELGSVEFSASHLRIPPRFLFVSDAILADILAEA